MEHLIKEHGPLSAVAMGMIFTGSFVNRNSTQKSISQTWCQMNSSSSFVNSPAHLEEIVLVLSIIVPVLPLFSNHFSVVNVEMLKSHVVGQSSSFGLSEIIRHYAVLPEPIFLKKCNISNQECFSKFLQPNLTFLSTNKSNSFCNRNTSFESSKELFDSIHHFPNPVCAILGSSLTTIIFILVFWHKFNKQNKSPYQTASWKQMLIIISQCIVLLIISMYCFYLYKKMDHVQILGVFLGAFVQFCVTYSLLKDS